MGARSGPAHDALASVLEGKKRSIVQFSYRENNHYFCNGFDKSLLHLGGRYPALLIKQVPTSLADALDSRLHGNTAALAKQIQHVRLPEINPGLNAKLDRPLAQRLQQRPLG